MWIIQSDQRGAGRWRSPSKRVRHSWQTFGLSELGGNCIRAMAVTRASWRAWASAERSVQDLLFAPLITLNYAHLFDVQNPKSCTYLRSFVKVLNTFYIS